MFNDFEEFKQLNSKFYCKYWVLFNLIQKENRYSWFKTLEMTYSKVIFWLSKIKLEIQCQIK
jgi:hypothetical protein